MTDIQSDGAAKKGGAAKPDGAWVLTIGDELLRGEIVDSNKSFFSERLLRLDIETARHVSVRDDPAAMQEVILQAVNRAQVVLISGGIGPTSDDLTTEVVAHSLGRLPLVRHEPSLERMRSYFASVGRELTPNNAKQVDFPQGATVLPNPLGTAPGFMLEIDGTLLFCTPGVPRELYRMVDEEILPRIAERRAATGVVRASLLRIFGLGESTLDHELRDLGAGDPRVQIGFRTQFPDNLVRIVVRAPDAPAAEQRLAELVAVVRERLGPLVVGEGERRLEAIVAELLLEKKRTVAVAESCTGGLIGSLLTDTPGSSAYFLAGLVTYSNESKQRELGVQADTLRTQGAVSEPVVRQMAEGVRTRSGAGIGLATTGIAGPDGGSADKPVGTLYVGLASEAGTFARRYQLLRERPRNKQLAAQIGLEWLRRNLLGLPLPDETFPRMRSARP